MELFDSFIYFSQTSKNGEHSHNMCDISYSTQIVIHTLNLIIWKAKIATLCFIVGNWSWWISSQSSFIISWGSFCLIVKLEFINLRIYIYILLDASLFRKGLNVLSLTKFKNHQKKSSCCKRCVERIGEIYMPVESQLQGSKSPWATLQYWNNNSKDRLQRNCKSSFPFLIELSIERLYIPVKSVYLRIFQFDSLLVY